MEAASSLGPLVLERSLGRNCHVSIAWVNCCQQPLGVVLSSPEHLGVGHSGRGNCAWKSIPSLRFVLPGASPVVPATSAPGPHLISRLQGFVLRLFKPAARKSVLYSLALSLLDRLTQTQHWALARPRRPRRPRKLHRPRGSPAP